MSPELKRLSEESHQHINKIIPVGIPDQFIEHGPREKLLGLLGLDVAGIIKLVKNILVNQQ